MDDDDEDEMKKKKNVNKFIDILHSETGFVQYKTKVKHVQIA